MEEFDAVRFLCYLLILESEGMTVDNDLKKRLLDCILMNVRSNCDE